MSFKGVTASYYATRGSGKAVDLEIFKLIDFATEQRAQPDEDEFRKIRDALQDILDPKELYEIVRRMRKKLKALEHATVMNALCLMEYLMQESHKDFHHAMSNRKLMKQMNKVIKSAKSGDSAKKEQAEKCLQLIQKWGKEFTTQLAIGKVFVETYNAMLKKNPHQFPSYEGDQASHHPVSARQQLTSSTSEDRKEVVNNVTSMLAEMISSCSSASDVRSNDVIEQLAEQCRGFQREIATLLSTSSEAHLASLLELNEKVLAALKLHEEASTKGPPTSSKEEAEESWDAFASSATPSRQHSASFQSFSGWSASSDESADVIEPTVAKTVRFTDDAPFDFSAYENNPSFPNSPALSPAMESVPPVPPLSSWPEGQVPQWEEPIPAPKNPFSGPVAPGWGGTPHPEQSQQASMHLEQRMAAMSIHSASQHHTPGFQQHQPSHPSHHHHHHHHQMHHPHHAHHHIHHQMHHQMHHPQQMQHQQLQMQQQMQQQQLHTQQQMQQQQLHTQQQSAIGKVDGPSNPFDEIVM